MTGRKADNTKELLLTNEQKTAIENAFTIATPATNTNNGEVNWDYTITEGELDFLAAGETVTAVFTVNVNDGHGGTACEDVTITITGTNDAPVVTVVDVSGDITEGSVLTDAGSVTFEDVDLTDRPTATEATKSVTGFKADNTTELLLTNDQKTAIENAFHHRHPGYQHQQRRGNTGTTRSPRASWTFWPQGKQLRPCSPLR